MKRPCLAFSALFAALAACLITMGSCMSPSVVAGPPDAEWIDDDIYTDLEEEYYLFDCLGELRCGVAPIEGEKAHRIYEIFGDPERGLEVGQGIS